MAHSTLQRCERCRAMKKTRLRDLWYAALAVEDHLSHYWDYCAACSIPLCNDCMGEGCCEHTPALSGMERDYPRSIRILLRKGDYGGALWEYAKDAGRTIWALLILTAAYIALTLIGTLPGPWHLFDHVQP